MDDNEKSNPWDALIEDLGAQPDESAFERHQPPPQEIPPTVEWSEADTAAEHSKSSPSDWNSLAESLGLEVEQPAEPEPMTEESAASEATNEPEDGGEYEKMSDDVVDVVEEGTQPVSDEPLSGLAAASDDSFAADSTDEFSDESADDLGDEEASADDELPPLPSQMDQALSDTAWEDAAEEGSVEAGVADDIDDDGQGISGEAARSAFDALFSDGASSWGSAFLTTPKQDDSPRLPAGGTADDDLNSQLSDSLDATTGTDDETTDRPKRKRSRRRRRGGKGRKPAGERTVEGETGDETSAERPDDLADETTIEEGKKPKRRRSRGRPRPVKKEDSTVDGNLDQDSDDELLISGDDEPGEDRPRGAGRGRQRHRNLPTWSEAIGMIVDANLEQRAKSPSKPQSSRGGRGGRGGGRRRKKPESK